jgi:hypothetical protein
MMFMETLTVYCEKHTKHALTLGGKDATILNVKTIQYSQTPI